MKKYHGEFIKNDSEADSAVYIYLHCFSAHFIKRIMQNM